MFQIYDWEATLAEERSDLMRASVLNWINGTTAYAASLVLAVDADLAFMRTAQASGNPGAKKLLELGAAAGLAWFGREWRADARQLHEEAYELV